MKINSLSTDEVLRSLVTSAEGLSEEEAKRRLAEFGYNEIEEIKKKPLTFKFFSQLTHFLAILLWVAALFSFLSEYLHPGEGMLTLGLAIVAVIFINAVFTFIQEYRAEKALEELKKLLPFKVKILRYGKEKEVHAKEIVPGDIIILSEGDKIPADARVLEASGLKVNNAPLTGESEPAMRSPEAYKGEFIESPNIAFAGTTVASGSGKAVAFSTGMRTEFGRIAHLTSAVEAGLSPLQKEIIKATRLIAAIAAAIGVFFFLLGFVMGVSFWNNFIFAIGVIVALVPEGMLPTVTLALAIGSQRMAKRKALIKTLTSVETLGSVTVICTDKTGTLTQNRMEVKEAWTPDDKQNEANLLMKTAYLCNNARFAEGQYKGDPTETALLKYAREAIGDITAERLSEIPFDSERKRMTVVYKGPRGQGAKGASEKTLEPPNPRTLEPFEFVAYTKGALESVLPLCSHVLINGGKKPVDENMKEKITDAYHSLMDKGLRVLSFACRALNESDEFQSSNEKFEESAIETDMIFIGLIGLEDPPRLEVKDAIRKCNGAGIRIIMITGDASRTAVAIAKEIGLVKGTPVVIEGSEFTRMRDKELRARLSEKEVIFARMTPKYKMRVVSILKEEGGVIAVTGDGVNDAPALKKADIGIAMGITGTDVAKETADMILLDDNFATIVNAVEEGRSVYENIRKFISYFFTSNIAELVPYIVYVLFRVPLPLTIMQILAVDLGTDMLPGLALGAEKPTKDIMTQQPRKPGDRLLNLKVLSLAFLFLGPIEAAAGLFGYFYVMKSGGWQWGAMLTTHNVLYIQATTACLTGIVVAQIANVFACRSFRESVFTIGLFSNKLIFIGIAFEIALQLFIVYHPWGNAIFSTLPITTGVWLALIPFAVILFFAEETRKLIIRKKGTPALKNT